MVSDHKMNKEAAIMRKLLAIAILIAGSAIFSNIQGQEADKKIARKNLPKAVEATVARESRGARIKGIGTEREGGVLVYELELVAEGLSRDMLIDKRGKIMEVEQEVSMDSLSDDVKAGLNTAAGKGTITKVVSLSKKGKIVAYEAAVTNGKKHSEVQVDPNGRKPARPE
jgi:uncharacterized membrane protein YkoI